MNISICKYCKTQILSKHNLKRHQQTEKCLNIQNELNNENSILNKITKYYENELDKLNQLNSRLTSENKDLNRTINILTQENISLKQTKDTL